MDEYASFPSTPISSQPNTPGWYTPSANVPGQGGYQANPSEPPSYFPQFQPNPPQVSINDKVKVPPPILLRYAGTNTLSNKGSLKIHVPGWATTLIQPPQVFATGERLAPQDDTVLTGSLEVTMKERRKVQAISVGVQSVCRLFMGDTRGWEEDGVFERGVEVLGGNEEGIWLEQGSQSFSFNILLPATLATTNWHKFGRLSYIITARVQGVSPAPYSNFPSLFKANTSMHLDPEIRFVHDFEKVIARSAQVLEEERRGRAREVGLSPVRGKGRSTSKGGVVGHMRDLSLGSGDKDDPITHGRTPSPSMGGHYTRRQNAENPPTTPPAESDLPKHLQPRSEKTGWMKGDLAQSRELWIQAISPVTGDVLPLDMRRESFVEGLGPWKFRASADVFAIAAVILIDFRLPLPKPTTSIFLLRLTLSQRYTLTSPRTPDLPPYEPQPAQDFVIYQVGKPGRQGERFPGLDVGALWRGTEVEGKSAESEEGKKGVSSKGQSQEGWKIKAVARLPTHDKIRPSTNEGTITPIRVSHELIIQVYYSCYGEKLNGEKVNGPGELRRMTSRSPINVPSCHCIDEALHLPPYDSLPPTSSSSKIDSVISSPPDKKKWCMCGPSFEELGKAAMEKDRIREALEEHMEEEEGGGAGGSRDAERVGRLRVRAEATARNKATSGGSGGSGGSR
ncbi:hypothetical protein B9479_003847 [Cryptococcus floricola]|uniref:Arrestin-like N-terminal domain-containing protein n=1 Tax=Cryptococcus floricola TaxID=2591691 RepID=A0A5D3AVL3_9TREE|nr:hypothetical protein B9479_003847 [Cryptococcus floricola]